MMLPINLSVLINYFKTKRETKTGTRILRVRVRARSGGARSICIKNTRLRTVRAIFSIRNNSTIN